MSKTSSLRRLEPVSDFMNGSIIKANTLHSDEMGHSLWSVAFFIVTKQPVKITLKS
jgi:hypothetical protein